MRTMPKKPGYRKAMEDEMCGECAHCQYGQYESPGKRRKSVHVCGPEQIPVGQYMVCDEFKTTVTPVYQEVNAELEKDPRPYVSFEEYTSRVRAKEIEIAQRAAV